jgi:hypothetical protein
MIIKRVLKRLRAVWPETHIVLRGDGHFSNPELMQLAIEDPHTDFIFGLTGNAVLSRPARIVTTELHYGLLLIVVEKVLHFPVYADSLS